MSNVNLSTGLPQDQTGDKPYLQFGNQFQTSGIHSSLFNNVDFNTMMWPQSLLTQALANGSLAPVIPNPLVGYRIQLPDGSATTPALGWTEAAESASGLYRIGANDYGYEVAGSLVTEWKAAEFRVNYLTPGSVVFAGTSGKLEQDNASFFFDDTSNFLKLESSLGKQIRLQYDSTTWSDFTVDINGNLYSTLTTGPQWIFKAFSPLFNITGTATNQAVTFRLVDNDTTLKSQLYYAGDAAAGSKATILQNYGGDYLQFGSNGSIRFADKFLGTEYVRFLGNGDVSFGTGSFYWDNANLFQTNTSTLGKQLRLAYDSTHYLDIQAENGSGGFGMQCSFIPSGTQNNAFAQMKFLASDFSFSYTGSTVNGEGVPNVTISGPPNTGTYTAASGPGFNLNNELSAVDNKLWAMYLNDKTLTFQAINDANNIVTNWLTVLRNGNSISAITFPSATGALSCSSWLNLGTTTDATAQGDFSTGKTGVARLSYVQATPSLTFFNASNVATLALTSTALTFSNAQIIQWKDTGGTARSILRLHSDNHIYFDNTAAGSFFLRGGTSAGNTNNFVVILNTGVVGIQTTTPRRFLDVLATSTQFRLSNVDNSVFSDFFTDSSGNLTISPTGTQFTHALGANGQKVVFGEVTELTTVAAAATTDTAIQIPANAVVMGVSVRVTVVIPTAATFTVTGTASGTQFDVAGGVAAAANTTDVGTRNCTYSNAAAQTIRITPNINPAANTGRVRVTIQYYTITPPTS